MSLPSNASLADRILPAVCEAARRILKIRADGMVVDRKADQSPVTEADRQAQTILVDALATAAPGVAVVAEEDTEQRTALPDGAPFFLVDPLDGTRDYCAGRDDFTINIGLIEEGRPVFGLVYAPARGEFFVTPARGKAVWAPLDANATPASLADLDLRAMAVRAIPATGAHAILSRSEAGEAHAERVAKLGGRSTAGISSAVKFCLIGRGDADLYPRFGPTCEWDTAAGQAILEAAGGSLTQLDGAPMIYGKSAAGYLNGPFIARGAPAV